jgi:hypothetical protein
MKRIIKDYRTLSPEYLELIDKHYPNGFESDNLISFVTPKGEFIKALEIKTSEAIYLFKIDKNMELQDEENQENENMAMSEFENYKSDDSDTDEDDDDGNDDGNDELSGGNPDDGDDERDSDEDN